MTQRNLNGELRAAFTMRLLDDAERSLQRESGPANILMRVTLAIVFMYLIVISYLMFGTIGMVFVSILSLVAYFVPHLYQALMRVLGRRRAETENGLIGQESPQEG